jgi:hypothetical protein
LPQNEEGLQGLDIEGDNVYDDEADQPRRTVRGGNEENLKDERDHYYEEGVGEEQLNKDDGLYDVDEEDQPRREDLIELEEGEEDARGGKFGGGKLAADEPFQKPKRGRLDGSVLDTMAYELLQEMNDAINKDNAANIKGLPGMAKLGMVERLTSQMKSTGLQTKFLEQDGLEMINRFISKLPDGSWPLSSARAKVLELIFVLPTELDQLRSTNLGRTLSNLQTSPNEFKANKKIIQYIKDKWSRKICNISVEYTRLENEEVTIFCFK